MNPEKQMSKLLRLKVSLLALALLFAAGCASKPPQEDNLKVAGTLSEETVLDEAEDFFGDGAAGLADIVRAAFREKGRPNAYIKGEEVGGAVAVGLRYGAGTLVLANGETQNVYWQGPSVGFDIGGNASKAFILVYNLTDTNSLFQRYPGVEGSLYFVGGVSVNYNQSGNTVLAPIRFGVGWRQGANIGYLHMTPKKSWIPF